MVGKLERNCSTHAVTDDSRPLKPQFVAQICQIIVEASHGIFLVRRVANAMPLTEHRD
jgi:hypothetical protein